MSCLGCADSLSSAQGRRPVVTGERLPKLATPVVALSRFRQSGESSAGPRQFENQFVALSHFLRDLGARVGHWQRSTDRVALSHVAFRACP